MTTGRKTEASALTPRDRELAAKLDAIMGELMELSDRLDRAATALGCVVDSLDPPVEAE